MSELILCVVLHSGLLAQLHLCVYLHAHTPCRVAGIPRSRAELDEVFMKAPLEVILCGGAFRMPGAKALRAEVRRRGLPVLLLRHHDRPTSLAWLRLRLARCTPLLSIRHRPLGPRQ